MIQCNHVVMILGSVVMKMIQWNQYGVDIEIRSCANDTVKPCGENIGIRNYVNDTMKPFGDDIGIRSYVNDTY